MENKNGLVLTLIILTAIAAFACGFIVSDKILNKTAAKASSSTEVKSDNSANNKVSSTAINLWTN